MGQPGYFIWESGGELGTQAGACVPSVEAFKLTIKKKSTGQTKHVWGPDMAFGPLFEHFALSISTDFYSIRT